MPTNSSQRQRKDCGKNQNFTLVIFFTSNFQEEKLQQNRDKIKMNRIKQGDVNEHNQPRISLTIDCRWSSPRRFSAEEGTVTCFEQKSGPQ